MQDTDTPAVVGEVHAFLEPQGFSHGLDVGGERAVDDMKRLGLIHLTDGDSVL